MKVHFFLNICLLGNVSKTNAYIWQCLRNNYLLVKMKSNLTSKAEANVSKYIQIDAQYIPSDFLLSIPKYLFQHKSLNEQI